MDKNTTATAESALGSGRKLKVAIVGAGISGLAVANGLLNDPADRFEVNVYERDSIAFDSERGGYQIRIAGNGMSGLRAVTDDDSWNMLREAWASGHSRAPALVEPKEWRVCLDLAKFKAYPASRPIPRANLRQILLQKPMAQGRVHFDHKFERFDASDNGDEGWIIHFEKGNSVTADILIAADGSNSRLNRQVGLNNKTKLNDWTLIQSQGRIDRATRDKFPKTLLERGSTLFLGGRALSGFVSVYDVPTHEVGGKEAWHVFWSVLIPSSLGDSILAKAGDDHDIIISLLNNYISEDLDCGQVLPVIISSVTGNLRTGQLTSSVKPSADWRKDVPGNATIILLGDAVHPMTPGRGQGANQAITDAGNLITLLRNTRITSGAAREEEWATVVKQFEAEMYPRAFEMVKKSEMVTDVDLTTFSGRLLTNAIGAVLTVVGWGMLVLEFLQLKKVDQADLVA